MSDNTDTADTDDTEKAWDFSTADTAPESDYGVRLKAINTQEQLDAFCFQIGDITFGAPFGAIPVASKVAIWQRGLNRFTSEASSKFGPKSSWWAEFIQTHKTEPTAEQRAQAESDHINTMVARCIAGTLGIRSSSGARAAPTVKTERDQVFIEHLAKEVLTNLRGAGFLSATDPFPGPGARIDWLIPATKTREATHVKSHKALVEYFKGFPKLVERVNKATDATMKARARAAETATARGLDDLD